MLSSAERKAVVCVCVCVLDLWSGHRNSGEVVPLTGGWVCPTCGTLSSGGKSVDDLSCGVIRCGRSLAFRT